LGHPIADLAWLCKPWTTKSYGLYDKDGSLPEGVPSEDEFVQLYAGRRGWPRVDPKEWDFFKALDCFRTVGINHGVYARAVMGNAASSTMRGAGANLDDLVRLGLSFAHGTYRRPGAGSSRL